MQQLDSIDQVPKFGVQNRYVAKRKEVGNDLVREVLERSLLSPAKRVCDDLGISIGTVYKIKSNYMLVHGVLFRKVEDGNVQ